MLINSLVAVALTGNSTDFLVIGRIMQTAFNMQQHSMSQAGQDAAGPATAQVSKDKKPPGNENMKNEIGP